MKMKTLLTFSLISATLAAGAQSNVGFAISGDANRDYAWMNIQKIDLSTGKVQKTVFQKNKTDYTLTDAVSKAGIDKSLVANGNIYNKNYPTGSLVASAAYDRRSGKLFFVPMRTNEMRWVDLDGNSDIIHFYTIASTTLKTSENFNDESNNVTRMAIGADGYGYAVTNDGNHLYKFTTGKTPTITDLGPLVDATENTTSVHNKCSSWGGDMVADAFGKLYIFTANHHVYVTDINTRITEYKGQVKGLPSNFTVNGAAVDADDNIIISSATSFAGFYKVDIKDYTASQIAGSDAGYSVSDLASGNVLFEKTANAFQTSDFKNPIIAATDIYPNPVTGSAFKVQLNGYKAGIYTLSLNDVSGRAVYSKKINVNASGYHTENITLAKKPVSGMYMVKVMNEKGQILLSDKLMVQ